MPKKVEQYENECKLVLEKMFQILGINDQNNIFSLHNIDNDIDKQNAIIHLEDEIKKYFLCGEWTCFKKKSMIKRRWLSMIKYVIKDMKYIIISNRVANKQDDNTFKNDTVYHIINPSKYYVL